MTTDILIPKLICLFQMKRAALGWTDSSDAGLTRTLTPTCLAMRHHGPDVRAIWPAAASLRGLRSSNCSSHPDADLLPGLA